MGTLPLVPDSEAQAAARRKLRHDVHLAVSVEWGSFCFRV